MMVHIGHICDGWLVVQDATRAGQGVRQELQQSAAANVDLQAQLQAQQAQQMEQLALVEELSQLALHQKQCLKV